MPSGLPSLPVPTRLTAHVKGHVQGVGFRWWTRARALELGPDRLGDQPGTTAGSRSSPRAPREACEALLGGAPRRRARPGRVDFVAERWGDARGGPDDGFVER